MTKCVPTFDIFSGRRDKEARWKESIRGLGAAYQRMTEIADETAGPYFLFHAPSHTVVGSIDTSLGFESMPTKPKSLRTPAIQPEGFRAPA